MIEEKYDIGGVTVEERISGWGFHFSVVGMVTVGFFITMLGLLVCPKDLRLGSAIAVIGLSMLACSALIAAATAMSKPEPLVERTEIDWESTERREPIYDADGLQQTTVIAIKRFTKGIALAVVYRTVGKTAHERRVSYCAMAAFGILLIVGLAMGWSRGH